MSLSLARSMADSTAASIASMTAGSGSGRVDNEAPHDRDDDGAEGALPKVDGAMTGAGLRVRTDNGEGSGG